MSRAAFRSLRPAGEGVLVGALPDATAASASSVASCLACRIAASVDSVRCISVTARATHTHAHTRARPGRAPITRLPQRKERSRHPVATPTCHILAHPVTHLPTRRERQRERDVSGKSRSRTRCRTTSQPGEIKPAAGASREAPPLLADRPARHGVQQHAPGTQPSRNDKLLDQPTWWSISTPTRVTGRRAEQPVG